MKKLIVILLVLVASAGNIAAQQQAKGEKALVKLAVVWNNQPTDSAFSIIIYPDSSKIIQEIIYIRYYNNLIVDAKKTRSLPNGDTITVLPLHYIEDIFIKTTKGITAINVYIDTSTGKGLVYINGVILHKLDYLNFIKIKTYSKPQKPDMDLSEYDNVEWGWQDKYTKWVARQKALKQGYIDLNIEKF